MAALMVARRSRTTALRRRWPRRRKFKLGRASTTQDELNAQASVGKGGRWHPSHGDGLGGDASVRLSAAWRLTERGQQARVDAVSHGGDGGVVAVVEKWRGRAGVGNGDGGERSVRQLLLRRPVDGLGRPMDGLGGPATGFSFFCFSCLIYGGGQSNRLRRSRINRDL